MTLDKDVLMDSIRPLRDILNPDDNNRLTFEIKGGKMAFYNDDARFSYGETVDFDGEFVIDVNGVFMIDTLEAINDDRVLIKFSDENGVLNFDSKNYEDQKALITPIRRR